MRWPWSSSSDNKNLPIEAKGKSDNVLDEVDPQLRDFYYEAKPPTPISLLHPKQPTDEKAPTVTTPPDTSTKPHKTKDNEDRKIIQTVVQDIPEVAQLYGRKEGPRKISLQQAARDNCVEFEIALSNCLIKGSIWDRFLACYPEKMSQQRCNDLQEFALAALGYNPDLDEPIRKSIIQKADDIMIQTNPTLHISAESGEAFKEAVKKSKREREREGSIYRTY